MLSSSISCSRLTKYAVVVAAMLAGRSAVLAAETGAAPVNPPYLLLQSTAMPADRSMTTTTTTTTTMPMATTSQQNNTQLNQLPEFETTPDICAAGEWYATAHFDFLQGVAGAGRTNQRFLEADVSHKSPQLLVEDSVQTNTANGQQYRYEIQGQYGVTDNIALGGYIPIVSNSGQDTGTGDVGFYAQYKLDRIIDPNLINVTGQVDIVFPTGSTSEFRDSGRLGIRPLLLAYKNFGLRGPGVLGAYGLVGFTVQKNSDVRLGLAASYEYEKFVGLLEFSDIDGSGAGGQSLVLFTPGVVYRGFKNFEVSVGVPIGMDHSSPDWGVDFKVTYAYAK